jgi:hypothetical protein
MLTTALAVESNRRQLGVEGDMETGARGGDPVAAPAVESTALGSCRFCLREEG